MSGSLLRNFVLFNVILLLTAGALAYAVVKGESELDRTDELVDHTYQVILEAEHVSFYVSEMLAQQRGYLLTGRQTFVDEYMKSKGAISDRIAQITELTVNNPSQQSRLDEMRNYFTAFTAEIEKRAKGFEKEIDPTDLDDVSVIRQLKTNLHNINQSILQEEYALLNNRVDFVENKKTEYLKTLLIGLVVSTVVLLIMNGFLFFAQTKYFKTQGDLKNTEDRFAMAIDGTQDGIFDWDVEKDVIFYSARYFEMLGYERKEVRGSPKDALDLIHPEDKDHVWEYAQQYLNGELSEFSIEFRMKHANGRWVWIHSRAKASFDKRGKAHRLVGAHTDISVAKREQEKLAQEKKEAEEANRSKTEFLSHMSHEIRTPLTAISGIAEILEKKQANLDDKQKQLVKTLSSSSSTLKDLVNDVLDFSKIESGEMELDEVSFTLDDVFEGVISIMALRAAEKGISFVFDYSEVKGKSYIGDIVRMRQILINLSGNAIKFTDEGGVTIKAAMEDREGENYLRVEIADTGFGISPENFDIVFERFKQADQTVSRKFGGTGLGLPISRNLAQLMGGDIFLSSEYGKGSVFTLLLPIKSNDTVKVRTKDFSQKTSDKLKKIVTGENKILVVEDYEGNIVVIGYILEDLGIEHDFARNGVEALEMWKKHHYDIVLMDVQMPEMDGFTATRKIREEETKKKLERTPIIGMTAHALVGDKDKCIEAGMDVYLPKPLVEADLKEEIFNFLDQSKAA